MKTSRSSLILAVALALLTLAAAFDHAVRLDAQGNGPSFPDPAALRPFQVRLCTQNGIQGCDPGSDRFTVPVTTTDGKPVLRLVIEYVSGSCSVGSGGTVFLLSLDTVVNGTLALHSFVPVATATSEAVTSQITRLYADPGTTVRTTGSVFSAFHSCRVTVSGYLAVQ